MSMDAVLADMAIVCNAVVVVAQVVFLVQLEAYARAQKQMERRCGEENSHDGLIDQLVWGTMALTATMAALLAVQVHRRATRG